MGWDSSDSTVSRDSIEYLTEAAAMSLVDSVLYVLVRINKCGSDAVRRVGEWLKSGWKSWPSRASRWADWLQVGWVGAWAVGVSIPNLAV